MINKINILRKVASNLTPHLIMEGKTIIKKPGVIIPGAAAVLGTVVTLETKENNANLVIQKGNDEIQRATFNYNETPDGYELSSAMSSYFYNDIDRKELQQNHYLIDSEHEKTYEHSINYANAPIKKTTREYIDKLNSSIAQVSGYQSNKTDYDQQESHTYGKKSLQRDIPALLKFLDIIAPNSEFTLKIKDKLKKDNKTSLIAFEVNDTKNGNEIVRGFMSTSGDSVSYRINTEDMILIGEQSPDKDLSKSYLKPRENTTKQKEIKKETTKDSSEKQPTKQTVSTQKQQTKNEKKDIEAKAANKNATEKPHKSKPSTHTDKNNTVKDPPKNTLQEGGKTPTIEPMAPTAANNTHVYSKEYYTDLIIEAATNKKIPTRKKADIYKETLAYAYLDGYNRGELEDILLGNGLTTFSKYCKKAYVEAGITLAQKVDKPQIPVKTLDYKIKELKNIKIDLEDDDLKICTRSMINEIAKIEYDAVKEAFVDKALNLLKENSLEDIRFDLFSFLQEASKINDDLKLHFEIYNESINNTKINTLKSQIEQMVNNISDTHHHEQRGKILTQLYISKDLKELEQLKNQVQKLLNEQPFQQIIGEIPEKEDHQKLSLKSLSGRNQKLVGELLDPKCRPSKKALAFKEVKNLLLDIGFSEANVDGSHHKFIPPQELYIKGRKQPMLTIVVSGSKTLDPAVIDDLMNVCRYYYGN